MPLYENDALIIEGATVVWEGVTQPEPQDGGGVKYTLKCVVPPQSPDVQLLHDLGGKCLQQSEFKGQLPAGAYWITKQADANEFQGMFPGWWVVNGITYNPPQVYDENGQQLQPMQFGSQLYNGQKVDLLITAKAYNNKSKGIKAQLEGFRIIASAQAPRLNLGGSSVNVGGAFGGRGQQPPQNQGYGQQPPQNQGYGQQPPQNQGGGGYPQGQPPQQGANPYGSAQTANSGYPTHQGQGHTTAPNGSAGYATTSPSNQQGQYPQHHGNYLPPQGR